MRDKSDHNQTDPLLDTQQLLQDLDIPAETYFNLDDILEEYGEQPAREDPGEERKVIPFPGTVVQPEEEDAPPALQPDNEIDGISPEDLFGLPAREKDEFPVESGAQEELAPCQADEEPETEEATGQADEEEFVPISMEDIVASTVDAVKEEQAIHQAKLLKKLEKERKKSAPKKVKRRNPALRQPLPDIEDETPPAENAKWHKHWYLTCRKCLIGAAPVLFLLWLPWVLTQFGINVPFFSKGGGNEALCVLVPQAVLCVLCWPVFLSALEALREGRFTACTMSALCSIVTFLDALTLLFLPQRSAVPPLGGVAATSVFFALWGLMNCHKGMWQSFRTCAMGQPTYLVDTTDHGIAKGRGSGAGFQTRLYMEDTASQWQRLLLPLMAVAALVLALLSSLGRGRSQDFLWCWSAGLCAASSLVYPLAYSVPFGLLATRLGRSGAAVAGQYGAAVLASCRQIAVTDHDLFPQGTVSLNGLKLYGEERNHALSYAGTLAIQGGGCLSKVFEDICRSDRIPFQPLEHFHIHDDGGLSGMIRGETVLLGPPVFMRHRGVRLPATLPAKTAVCLAVDQQLVAVFAVKYNTSPTVENALHMLVHSKLHLALATRDGNISAKLLKTRFGTDGGAVRLDVSDRLSLSDPERQVQAPSGLLYRDGLFPYAELITGSWRLCHTVNAANLLSLLGSVLGVLLAFYLTFTGSFAVLSPLMLVTYLLLWALPLLPLLWGLAKA